MSSLLKIVFKDVIEKPSDENSILGLKDCTNSLSFNLDKSEYYQGDNIIISGSVSNVLDDFVTLNIANSENKQLSYIGQYSPDKEGKFSDIVKIGSTFGGGYTVTSQYKTIKCSQNFSLDVQKNISYIVNHNNNESTISISSIKGYIDSIDIDAYNFSVFFTSERGISGEIIINIPKVIMNAKKMNGDNDIWIILIDNIEIDYTEKETNDSREISFSTPYTKEIRIIGTHVIPEFESII